MLNDKKDYMLLSTKKTPEKGLYVTVPLHGNKEILPSTLLSIIRQAGMTKDKFVALI